MPGAQVHAVSPLVVARFAEEHGGQAGRVEFRWSVTYDGLDMTTAELVAEGRTRLCGVADRYDLVVLADRWEIQARSLHVVADVVFWPAADGSVRRRLVDPRPVVAVAA
jgi:hypothetical protein